MPTIQTLHLIKILIIVCSLMRCYSIISLIVLIYISYIR